MNWVNSIRGLILDMDGVLWLADQPIGDLPAIFNTFDRLGLKVTLATNNATRPIPAFIEKMRVFGVELEDWQVINSSQAVAHFLHQKHPQGGPVYIVGETGLEQALNAAGFYHAEENPLAVIGSMDRQVNFGKLRAATLHIRSGVPFIGTNPDRSFPTPEGLIPGAGAILAAIEAATDIAPLIIGKPSPEMYRVALERLKLAPEETLVVGDRLETDILGAQAINCRTALVLSGVTSPQAAAVWCPAPDLIAADLAAVAAYLSAG